LKSSSRVTFWAIQDDGHSTQEPSFELAFKGGGRDDFFKGLQTALQRKAWETIDTVKKEVELGTSGAGIAGLLLRQQHQQQHLDSLSSEAFSDLDGLISKAKEIVAVISRYNACQENMTGSRVEDCSLEQQEEEANQLRNALLTIGFVSPVTKELAGTQFHSALARQLSDFMTSRQLLSRFGGMITLHDLYCLYNRARGTELVSPDDLLKACSLLNKLRLGMSLRVFSSGVKVVQSDLHDDSQMSDMLAIMAEENTYITSFVVSSNLRISILLSQQHLLIAEELAYLCRDECAGGTLFYPNLFTRF